MVSFDPATGNGFTCDVAKLLILSFKVVQALCGWDVLPAGFSSTINKICLFSRAFIINKIVL